jgi:uncharacterized protein (TIRG00374 family)
MASQERLTPKIRYLLILVGVIAFLLYFYLFVPFGEVVETVQRDNPFYFFLALCALLASVAFYALAWQQLLHLLSVRTSFLKAFQYVWVENFVDLVIPGEPVSGELSRVYLMSKDTGADYGKVAASAVGHRIATTSVTVVGLLASIVYFAIAYRPPLFVLEFASVVLLGDAIVIGLLFYLAVRKGATHRLVDWGFNFLTRLSRGRWRFEHMKEETLRMLDMFHKGILTLGEHRKGFVLPMLFTAFSWLLDVSIAILVFLSLGSVGTEISMSAIVIVYSITGAIQYLPIGVIPGEVGLAEIVMTTLFTLLGSSRFIALFAVATLFIRCITFWIKLIISGTVVQLSGIKSLMPSQTPNTQSSYMLT